MAVGAVETIEERVSVGGREVIIARPRDFEELLTEEAFEREELLPYWAHLWPSAVSLARLVGDHVRADDRVLELGCGLGLVSIAAACAGARVTATDWTPEAIESTAANAARNCVELEAFVADWDRPGQLTARAPWDLVVAADVLYERKKVATMLELLPRLSDQVLIADPERVTSERFFADADNGWDRAELSRRTNPRVVVHRLRRRAQACQRRTSAATESATSAADPTKVT